MNKKNSKEKKLFTIAITLSLLLIIPTINANSLYTKKTQENITYLKTENTNENIYDLLILTPSEFENLLKPLKNHKERVGVKTQIATLNQVYKQTFWQGRDKPEKIKYFIKNAYDNWGIKYVMLVGDNHKMPVRYVHNQDNWEGYPELTFISELYYADIYDENQSFSSWNSDNDIYFGEWIDDNESTQAEDKNIDLRPDVYVGRLACRNKFEVKIMVNKIITYETQTYNKEWFNRFVVVSGDTYPEGQYPFNTSGYEGEENTEKAIENMTDFNPIRLWVSNNNFTGPKDVIRTINKGCGLMFFEGHASAMSWGTHPYNSHEFIYGLKTSYMWKLFNGYKLPVVVAGACHNGQFDITPLNLLKNFKQAIYHGTYGLECWAWKLTSKPFGGSIATISNTGLGMTKEDKDSMQGAGDFMDVQFFYHYGRNHSDILGELWGMSIERYLDYYPVDWNTPAAWDYAYDAKTVQEWTLFGDPSLKIGGYNLE